MKKCKICKKEFQGRGIKYCGNKCAYIAISKNVKKLKTKRERDSVKTKCICCNGKGYVLQRKRVAVTTKQRKQCVELYKKGYGIREIQRKLGLAHPYSVTYSIKIANDSKEFITIKKNQL